MDASKLYLVRDLFEQTVRSEGHRGNQIVFSHGIEDELGYPDLGTIMRFATRFVLTVAHEGWGDFVLKSGPEGIRVASFRGGGAMQRHANNEWIVSSTMFDFHGDVGKALLEKWTGFISDLRGVAGSMRRLELERVDAVMSPELIDGRW